MPYVETSQKSGRPNSVLIERAYTLESLLPSDPTFPKSYQKRFLALLDRVREAARSLQDPDLEPVRISYQRLPGYFTDFLGKFIIYNSAEDQDALYHRISRLVIYPLDKKWKLERPAQEFPGDHFKFIPVPDKDPRDSNVPRVIIGNQLAPYSIVPEAPFVQRERLSQEERLFDLYLVANAYAQLVSLQQPPEDHERKAEPFSHVYAEQTSRITIVMEKAIQIARERYGFPYDTRHFGGIMRTAKRPLNRHRNTSALDKLKGSMAAAAIHISR